MTEEVKYDKYISYINNTAMEPLPVHFFDDDWEPVGEIIRNAMVKADLIQVRDDGIYLRPDLAVRTV